MFHPSIRRRSLESPRHPRTRRPASGASPRPRPCCLPKLERLEEIVLLSTAPAVSLGGSSNPGSGGGTALVKDIIPGTTGAFPTSLVNAGGTLFFLSVDRNKTNNSLWISDGTEGGTVDITPGLEASTPVALGHSVVFTGFDLAAKTFGIWTSDGTAAGTSRIAALPRSSTARGVSAGGVAYFDILNNVTNKFELWKSDGTAAGTGMVANIPSSFSFVASGSKVYFVGNDPTTGLELWQSDGTAAGTHIVADLVPGRGGSYPSKLTDVGGTLFFIASDSSFTNHLWETDGTAAGTKQLVPGVQPLDLGNLGGKLVFTGVDSSYSNPTLWTSDGTAAGTSLVTNLPSGYPFQMAVAGGKAYFGLEPDNAPGFQLWKSDGTAAGTAPVTTLPDAGGLTASGSRLYFTLGDAAGGNELWTSDGTASGTALVADIRPGALGSYPSNLTDVAGTLYFTANDGAHGNELWKSVAPAAPAPVTSLNEGGTFTLSGSFSDDSTAGPWTATVDYGDGTGVQPLALNLDHTFSLSHTYQDDGAYPVTVVVTGSANLAGSATATVTVLNVAPTASITNAPGVAPEGTAITLSASVADPGSVDVAAGFTDLWTVTKDGAPYTSGTGATFSFLPNDNGTYVVTVTARDKDGGVSAAASHTISVTNVAPTSTINGAPTFSPEGTAIHLTSTVADPSSVDVAAGFVETWVVTKDGVAYASGTGDSLSFTPDDNGMYIVTLTAFDKDGGGCCSASRTIAVTNVDPSATVSGAPATGTEGSAIVLGGAATDPGAVDTATGFALGWSVERDGLVVASGTGAGFSFTPDDNGTYLVTLTATDKDGGVGTAVVSIEVANVAPSATIADAPESGFEGAAIVLGASATDPGPADAAAGLAFAWSVTKDGAAYASGSGATFAFTPDDNGTFVVTLTATDKDGGTSAPVVRTIAVSNVAPTVAIAGSPTAPAEGASIALSAAVDDPGAADAAAGFSRSWAVTRDGVVVASGTGSTFTFTPDDGGTYVVTVKATDKDGGTSDPASLTIAVANVAPTASFTSAPSTGLEGSALAFAASATDPSAADTAAGFAGSWTVTRNGVAFASGTGASFGFTPDDNGVYIVAFTATDKDGGTSAPVSRTVVVANVAPSAAIAVQSSGDSEGSSFVLSGTATDPGARDVAAGLSRTWTVARDGAVVATGSGANFQFTPGDNGAYLVTLTATDKDGGSSSASVSFAVANVAPSASVDGDSSGVRGQTRRFVLAAADPSDADRAAGFTYTINWGDGSAVQTVAPGASTTVGHVFTQSGSYTVTVTATDKDGGLSQAASRVVTVSDLEVQVDPDDPSKTALVVGGTTGDDNIFFRPAGSTGGVKVKLNGDSLGSYFPTGHIIVYGQAGDDDIQFADSITLPTIIHGGEGDDYLKASAGDNVLVAGSGNSVLVGSKGRNLLIGGAGSDQIDGRNGDNIVVSGSTAYDADDAALLAILGEWERDLPLVQRVGHLKQGLGGGVRLDVTTVVKDHGRDVLYVGGGGDWLLLDSALDEVRGRLDDSIVTYLDSPGSSPAAVITLQAWRDARRNKHC